jgi:hypothetical protein
MIIDGFEVHVSSLLTGTKCAYLNDTAILVSPAIWSLICGADSEEELRRLLASIPAKRIPNLLDFSSIELPLSYDPGP